MALTEERYKAEKKDWQKNNRMTKAVEKDLIRDLDKLVGLSLKEFQKGIVSALGGVLSLELDTRKELKLLGIEAGKSFGVCEKKFKEAVEVIEEIRDDIAHLKMAALKNSLITEEKLFLGRPITMEERRRIFASVKIDYDGFALAAEKAKKEALQEKGG